MQQPIADPTMCVSGSAAISRKWKKYFSLVTVHADRGEKCELWFMAFGICSRFWIHFHLFGGEISSTPGKTSSGDAGKRVWHPAREGKTQQSMLGVMTKNNGTLPHNRGSSNMILSAATLAVLYTRFQLLQIFVNVMINNQHPNERNSYFILPGFMIVPTVCACTHLKFIAYSQHNHKLVCTFEKHRYFLAQFSICYIIHPGQFNAYPPAEN